MSGEVVLVFHVTDRDLLTDDSDGDGLGSWPGRGGVARSPKLGPVLMARLNSWLLNPPERSPSSPSSTSPRSRPSTDTTRRRGWPPPSRMRDETCVYPGCGRAAEFCDLDHIDHYVPIA